MNGCLVFFFLILLISSLIHILHAVTTSNCNSNSGFTKELNSRIPLPQISSIVQTLREKSESESENENKGGREKDGKQPVPEFVRKDKDKTNFENLQVYFDSLNKNEKDKSASSVSSDSVSDGGLLAADGGNDDENPSSKRVTTRRPGQRTKRTTIRTTRRPTRIPSRRTTTTPAEITTATKRTRRTTTTTEIPSTTTTAASDTLTPLDSTWILLCAFLIFTMQTGFGLLEAGIVSLKNETNIMMKNVADVVLGGFTYWIFGYGISYGTWQGSSPVFGIGFYVVDSEIPDMGDIFTSFFFQLSFATTATTIVSGALAERCNFKAYCLYSLFSTITYSVQARWVWGPTGWLGELGVIDIAGSGSVHLVGGTSAFVAAWFIGPRLGRYEIGVNGHGVPTDKEPGAPPLGYPMNILLGLFFLWWGWFAFNAGSTYGVTEDLWKFSARACATTVVASMGGGIVGLSWSFIKSRGKIFDVMDIVNTVLGALVGITAGCAIVHTFEAFFIGAIGAIIVLICGNIPDLLKIDDPVGATGVHGFGGIWGMIAVGIFAESDEGILGVTKGNSGLFRGGGWYLIGVQVLACVAIIVWSVFSTFFILLFINLIVPLRVEPMEELLGLDFCEHGIRRSKIGMSPALSLFGSHPEVNEIHKNNAGVTGQDNPAHEKITETLRDVRIYRTPRSRSQSRSRNRATLNQQSQTKSPASNKRKLKAAMLFARAFNKLQNKGKNKVKPRNKQYMIESFSASLKSSTESLVKNYNNQLEPMKPHKNDDDNNNNNNFTKSIQIESRQILVPKDAPVVILQQQPTTTTTNTNTNTNTNENMTSIENDPNKMSYIP